LQGGWGISVVRLPTADYWSWPPADISIVRRQCEIICKSWQAFSRAERSPKVPTGVHFLFARAAEVSCALEEI